MFEAQHDGGGLIARPSPPVFPPLPPTPKLPLSFANSNRHPRRLEIALNLFPLNKTSVSNRRILALDPAFLAASRASLRHPAPAIPGALRFSR